jgi:hypothetical protein
MKIAISETWIERAQRVLSVDPTLRGGKGAFIYIRPNNDNIPMAASGEQLVHENRQRVRFFTG